jgi:hypothetical protein
LLRIRASSAIQMVSPSYSHSVESKPTQSLSQLHAVSFLYWIPRSFRAWLPGFKSLLARIQMQEISRFFGGVRLDPKTSTDFPPSRSLATHHTKNLGSASR